MAAASFQFLAFAFAVIVVFNCGRSVVWRQTVLLCASLVFLAYVSLNPLAWMPLAGFVAFGYLSLRAMQSGKKGGSYALIVAGTIFFFIWLKKYTFLPSSIFLHFPYLTLGLSYIFFRVLHLVIEARENSLNGRVNLVSYLNYILNFTTLISGPIQRYRDFADMQRTPLPLDIVVAGEAFERIVIGFFKVNVLSMLFRSLQNQALAALPLQPAFEGRMLSTILIAASYPLYLYCNFSGYIDVVIGLARFLRMRLPENFNRPFSSDNFLNFWSRWHITLSEWLKTYVHNPLLLNLMRRYPSSALQAFWGVLAIFVTFFLIGVWHGQTSVFVFFGVLQGLGVSVNKLYQNLMAKMLGRKRYKALANEPIYNVFARGLTFTWFTFTLLWFWSNWVQLSMLANAGGTAAVCSAWAVIFLGSSAILAAWETLRVWLLSWRWASVPVLHSRYLRTVRGTALVVIAVSILLLLNAPAPDIVYKAF
jgi:alginate O-acetyltransferase complex protein AlgI